MHKLVLSGLFTVLSHTATAQEFCVADSGRVPDCMVGTWSGSNDMAARLEQMFAGLPADVAAATRPTSGQYLFMHVTANGRFVSSPMEAAVDLNFINADGSVDWIESKLTAAGVIGQFTTGPGDAISFCQDSPGPDQLDQQGVGPVGAFATSMPLPAAGAQTMAMRYACGGDRLNMFIDLPPPIGTVTYDLIRVPHSALPADLDYLVTGR